MISIIIPVYNQAKELDICLNSIAKQSYQKYEIIVVDDDSTDDLFPVIKKHKERFGVTLEFLENDKNMGAPYTRNRGFKKSKGEFIIFCDADTYLEPNMLEIMRNTLRHYKNASFAYSSFLWGHKKFKLQDFDANKLKEMPYIHSNSLIRKEHFPESGWDESITKLQDWDLWLTMLEENHIGKWIDKVLFRVHNTKGTMSSWLPSFFYKIFPFLPKVRKYKKAMQIIKKKHKLNS